MKIKLKIIFILILITVFGSGWRRLNIQDAVKAVKTVRKVMPISVDEEIKLGRIIAANIVSKYGLYENDVYTGYLNYLGKALAYVNNPSTSYEYNFYILNSEEETAFAVPGGFIFVTKGMLYKIKDEASLAFVLIHEISHIENRDAVNQIQNQRLFEAGADIALTEKGRLLREAVAAFENLIYKGFSRNIELQRDADALIMMKKIGYGTVNVAELFKGFEGEKAFEGLNSTHPDYNARLKNIENYFSPGILNEERYLREVLTDS